MPLDYRRLAGGGGTIVELLSLEGAADIEFDPPRMSDELFRPADLS